MTTETKPPAAAGPMPAAPDAHTQLKSAGYRRLLILAAIIGAPISAAAYGFLQLTNHLQTWIFADGPKALGYSATPTWWPLPALLLCGILVGLTVRYMPGTGGVVHLDGFEPGGTPKPIELPGVFFAAVATLGFGAVLGPEAPLIALGGGLAVCGVRLARKDIPDRVGAVVAAAGSFAAVSALLGSPLLAAFLLMEASGLGGAIMGLILLPGLLAAGVGTLVFVGLDSATGLGVVSLALPNLPHFSRPTIAEFGWGLVIAVAASVVGVTIRWIGRAVRPLVTPRPVLLTPLAGLAVAGLCIAYTTSTDKSYKDVLFSGENDIGPLLQRSASYSVLVLLMLLLCKGLAYAVSLGSFRGGPIFPSMFLGAAGGVAMSHLPGLSLVPAVAMGIGALCVVMLRLPLTSVLLATLLLFSDGVAVTPLVIVVVVVAHVLTASLEPKPAPKSPTQPPERRITQSG